MNNDILLSLIVPVYNAENTLARCLDSILSQPFKNFEIIIVNDSSNDGSQQIIDNYVQNHSTHIRSYSKENGGPGDTRNYGIKKATGKYVTFVDSDDYLDPSYFVVIQRTIDTHEPDLVIIDYKRVYNRKQSLLERIHPFSSWKIYNESISIVSHPEVICRTEGSPWMRIIKRDVFSKNEQLYFSNAKIAEDQEASLKWFLHVNKIVFCNEKLYNYVIHSASLNFAINSIGDFLKVIDSVCSYYQHKGKFHLYYSELEIVFIKQLLISNIRRLNSSSTEKKFEIFQSLREGLVKHFPEFNKNKYLKNEPIYVRIAVYLSWHVPGIFKYIL